ncbi:MAG: Gfo/Idh/MocA family oxidoreductase [Pirellulales bacterium]
MPRLTEQELFTVSGLKAVVVETAVRDLMPTGRRVVDAGFALHMEKPAGESLPEFEKLLNAAQAKSLHVQLGYMLRHNPGVRFANKLIKAGVLGEIFEVEGSFGKIVGPGERKELAEFRGGGMYELGCHVIDAVTTILGMPERVTAFGRPSGAAPAELADNQVAVLEYPARSRRSRSR